MCVCFKQYNFDFIDFRPPWVNPIKAGDVRYRFKQYNFDFIDVRPPWVILINAKLLFFKYLSKSWSWVEVFTLISLFFQQYCWFTAGSLVVQENTGGSLVVQA